MFVAYIYIKQKERTIIRSFNLLHQKIVFHLKSQFIREKCMTTMQVMLIFSYLEKQLVESRLADRRVRRHSNQGWLRITYKNIVNRLIPVIPSLYCILTPASLPPMGTPHAKTSAAQK